MRIEYKSEQPVTGEAAKAATGQDLEAWFKEIDALGDSGEAERLFRRKAERYSGMIPNTIGA